MVVEFIGGPKDGDVSELLDGEREFRMRVLHREPLFCGADPYAPPLLRFSTHIYRLNALGTAMLHDVVVDD